MSPDHAALRAELVEWLEEWDRGGVASIDCGVNWLLNRLGPLLVSGPIRAQDHADRAREIVQTVESFVTQDGDLDTREGAERAVARILSVISAEIQREEREALRVVWRTHVPVTGTQHDPERGLLHGYCERCRVPWPCAWSPESEVMMTAAKAAGDNSLTAEQRSAKVLAILAQEEPARE